MSLLGLLGWWLSGKVRTVRGWLLRLAAWLRQQARRCRKAMWLAVYRRAGSSLGPDTREYWDEHWDNAVAFGLTGLSRTSFGLRFMRLLLEERTPEQDRDSRDRQREVRDARRGGS